MNSKKEEKLILITSGISIVASITVLLILGSIGIESHRLHLVTFKLGIALIAISFVVVGLFLICNTALKLNKDERRLKADQVSSELKRDLEAIVTQRTAEIKNVTERLILATTGSKIGIWDWDIVNNIMTWDDQMYPLYGILKNDFKGVYDSWRSGLHPDDVERGDYEIQLALKGKKEFETEFRVVWPDKTIHYIKALSKTHYDEKGNPIRMVGTNMDVTSQKQLYNELREGNNRSKIFIEQSPSAICMVDTNMRYIAASEQWLKDYNLVGRDIIGHSHYEIFPEIGDDWKSIHKESLKGKINKCDEACFERADGTIQWITWDVRPWYTSNENIGGILMLTADISARKRVEKVVNQNDRIFSTLFYKSPIIMTIIDASTEKFIDVNDAALRFWGYEKEELVGKTASDLGMIITPETRSQMITDNEKRGFIRNIEVLVKSKLGERWLSVAADPIELDGQDCFIYAAIDITETKIAGETLESQAENMETLNDQLKAQADFMQDFNAELQSEKHAAETAKIEAETARKDAEEANRAKSIFLATMSHEIRTPMNGVIGMVSLLSETSQTEEQQEYTEAIRSSGENLLTVINDILDFSKIESGKMELEQKDFDLRTSVEEVLDVFASKAAIAGLDLIYWIDYNVPVHIIGDSVRLKQVLLNLVSNAIKFTAKGEVFVGIHLLNVKGDAIELGFEVRDTGIGIPRDKIHRLFQAFSQVDSSTTRKFGGTGLGLVICEKLIKLMGGQILVESIDGKGTTFTFTIQTTISQQAMATYVNHNIDLKGKKVLVVDDNLTNRNILKNQLEQWKLVPTLTASAQHALEIIALGENFDLIVSDMQMPDMDGMELGRILRKERPTVPIILLSSIGDEKTKEHDELFAAVLTKPVRQSALLKHIVAQLSPQQHNIINDESIAKKLSIDFAVTYPLNILIAEDNPVNQKIAERVLSKLGYKPAKAFNGQEAIDALMEKAYDIILMDVQMPEMDGLEATRIIRMQPLVKQPIIIAMTANAMQGDREICIAAGMDDYISKPVNLEELVKLLAKWALHSKEKIL